MNYMLLIYRNEQDAQMDPESTRGCEGLAERLAASGQYLAGGILEPTASATSVRLREGRRLVTDGPFAETHEQFVGFLLFEAKDLDEAMTVAFQHPVAREGTVEIRPVREVPFLPSSLPTGKG